MMSVLRLLGIAAVLFSVCLINAPTTVEANLSLAFKVLKIAKHSNPANCTVGNTTYAHGQTFKLDCKTQCVCENGRHACSSLCPKEQLPAPEDTISCRSPRLVEVPGHCCKMWLCENPTADVYATCHNSSTSPWTPCSRSCGLGIATRYTSTTTGCRQLSNMRLCETRKCAAASTNKQQQQQHNNYATLYQQQKQHNHLMANAKQELHHGHGSRYKHMVEKTKQQPLMEHRIRKGHECRSIQRLGPARIRLDKCVSKKLYRPKLCGQCHQHSLKCCTPSVSTTIQVELLCPLIGINDPNHYVVQQLQQLQATEDEELADAAAASQEYQHTNNIEVEPRRVLALWDTVSLEPLDQEYLQSHQIQIENKFIAVEWILKCECSKHADNCSADRSSNINNNNNYRFYNANNNDNINANANNDVATNSNNNSSNDSNNHDGDSDDGNGDGDGDGNGNGNGSDEWQPDIIPYPQMSMKASSSSVMAATSTAATATRRYGGNNNIDSSSNNNNNNKIITNTNRITAKEHHHHYHHQQQQQRT